MDESSLSLSLAGARALSVFLAQLSFLFLGTFVCTANGGDFMVFVH
jgi:hypothetical protein